MAIGVVDWTPLLFSCMGLVHQTEPRLWMYGVFIAINAQLTAVCLFRNSEVVTIKPIGPDHASILTEKLDVGQCAHS
jgi:hypothetical protein